MKISEVILYYISRPRLNDLGICLHPKNSSWLFIVSNCMTLVCALIKVVRKNFCKIESRILTMVFLTWHSDQNNVEKKRHDYKIWNKRHYIVPKNVMSNIFNVPSDQSFKTPLEAFICL